MEWKTVVLHVSSTGNVRVGDGRLIPGRSDDRGYRKIELSVHRLVTMAFHGPPTPPRTFVDHIDGNRRNNSPTNLRWVTQKENVQNAARHRQRKLTASQLATIIKHRPPSDYQSLTAIAKQWGVSYSCLRLIRSGHNWKPGRNHNNNKRRLTDAQVAFARMWRPHAPTAAALGRRFGVSTRTILNVWQSVKSL